MASTHTIASDLSFLVLEKRRRAGELASPQLDERNRRLHPETGAVKVIRRLREIDEAEADLDGLGELKLRHGR